jgi:translation initiation factor 1 (eIF-1/SUI1)
MLFVKFLGILRLLSLVAIPVVHGFVPQSGKVSLAPPSKSSRNSCLHVLEHSFQDSALTLADGSSVVSELLGAVLLLTIGAFAYANAVYTPEILENSTQVRLQLRETQVRKLLVVVQNHDANGLDLEELRRPLEESFGMTIEEYVANVTTKKMEVTSADESLAEVLKSVRR